MVEVVGHVGQGETVAVHGTKHLVQRRGGPLGVVLPDVGGTRKVSSNLAQVPDGHEHAPQATRAWECLTLWGVGVADALGIDWSRLASDICVGPRAG